MNDTERRLIEMLFCGTGGQYFETIDRDGRRKPAIRTVMRDVDIKDGGFNKEYWSVEIDWTLLKQWMEIK